MSFSTILAADAAAIQTRLTAALQGLDDQPVIHAMRYALQGGKRLRGFLVLEGARMLGVDPAR
ncbi:MAG: polyprenyl synthetase family protein, partial [Rhodobacteraceae bacterium]|nr:polyprenyl synthetase family protein [Paracoccaceae bacterium]